jgi:hypothetical protein
MRELSIDADCVRSMMSGRHQVVFALSFRRKNSTAFTLAKSNLSVPPNRPVKYSTRKSLTRHIRRLVPSFITNRASLAVVSLMAARLSNHVRTSESLWVFALIAVREQMLRGHPTPSS